LCRIRVRTLTRPRAQNSTAYHNAYFGKRVLEEARGAAFAEIPTFCKLIFVRVSSEMAGKIPLLGISNKQLM